MVTTVPCDELHPSQLYISAQKMRDVVEWFDFDDPAHDALPTYILDGDLTLLDGHTRAFVAYLGGVDSLRIQELDDSDTEELNLELYRECLDWCQEEGVTDLSNLVGRVVSHTTYETKWIDRCHSSPHYE
ncbi:histone acetyltransferase [Halobacteriales archaeon QS_5_68_33]|nr:MAG: histone acetyltransferase [Halobacteriales archaeon QS_5_68_33]